MTDVKAYHTDLHACLLDLLNFIAEQIERAAHDPVEQYVAVDSARGVIPLMRSRLGEDDRLKTIFMLVFEQQVEEPWWREWWDRFAKLEPQEFSKEADKLINGETGSIAVLRQSLMQNQPRE
ncbi:MAG TPA: hypothetical protein VFT69_15380 [Pseudolabrys sp.]|nr:hypothetical protein [Pseudolabrys sp.]